MPKVLITVDTEVWPQRDGWPHTPLEVTELCEPEIDAYFWGGDRATGKGVNHQLNTLTRYGLKATYLIDPMFSFALGVAPLEQLVAEIVRNRQEVGLHLHPEWLTDPRCAGLPAFRGPLLSGYSESEQALLVAAARTRLIDAGAPAPVVFRAGNWGANLSTFGALAKNGIRFDTSLNPVFETSLPDLAQRFPGLQPFNVGDTVELPVTYFADRTAKGRRPLHVCATSLAEFVRCLEHARNNQWEFVVIVLHSFEFIRTSPTGLGNQPSAQRLLLKRFDALCDYLARERKHFPTVHFRDIEGYEPSGLVVATPCRSGYLQTLHRHGEQLLSRFY